MKEFIDYKGEYNYSQFKIGELTFTLVGTEIGNIKSTLECIDTFKSSNGIFSERKRDDVRTAFLSGKIEIIESSQIKIPTGSSKDRKGRAT